MKSAMAMVLVSGASRPADLAGATRPAQSPFATTSTNLGPASGSQAVPTGNLMKLVSSVSEASGSRASPQTPPPHRLAGSSSAFLPDDHQARS
eukprot:CAMPEP_0202917212 /NCGR_PEP_ID=MMETSP1392-20130828/70492_1 /ASSEMBLY_ACC=CAM_ASM_000868 /TAXON_ID=225041 /ORGANISM="Chlamydomonas chlamydogama, Strain SAG 11-48b" /LENGTH=92 /DNA_ID=CAMNT_0049609889 /DNA_START=17 /DNA_END=298 /DNA_ORIENTATION=-